MKRSRLSRSGLQKKASEATILAEEATKTCNEGACPMRNGWLQTIMQELVAQREDGELSHRAITGVLKGMHEQIGQLAEGVEMLGCTIGRLADILEAETTDVTAPGLPSHQ